MWASLSGDVSPRQVMTFARDRIKDKLQTVNGVGEVILGGYIEPNLRIWIDPKKLQRLELTVLDIIRSLTTEHVEVPAGRLETPQKEENIRSLGEATTPEEVGNIQLRQRGGDTIYKSFFLKDVASVELGMADIRRMSRTNGETSIGLGIKKQRGSNAVAVARGVKEQIEIINKDLPKEYKLQVVFDSTQFIEATNSEMKRTLLEAALLTAVICLMFLASWGSTFNILLAIPTSILGSFLFLYFFGFTLNTFTMLGLILAVGIVVDDAIMVLENIFRHKEMGKSSEEAARAGSREITSAAIATTLALIAIFLPVVFMKGIIGKFFFQFGVTMSVAVALSLLEALTLTPMRAARLIGASHQEGRFARLVNGIFNAWKRAYQKMLSVCLNWRWAVVGITLLFFAGSLSVWPSLKKEFVPPQDQSMFLVLTQTPIGSSLQFTDSKMRQAEAIIKKTPELLRYFVAVGGFGTGGEANRGIMFLSLKHPEDRPVDPQTGKRRTQLEIMHATRQALSKISDFRVVLQDFSTRGFTAQRGFPVEFTVRGPDWEKLTSLSQDLLKQMEKNEYFTDVDTDYEFGQPEIQILPKRLEAAARGVSVEDIGKTIQAMFGGIEVGKFTEEGRRNDVRIRLMEESRQTSEDMRKLYVRNHEGELIPLSDVVEIRERLSLKSITRRDRERAIGISANVGPGKSQDLALKEVSKLAAGFPPGYRVVFSGSAETFRESFQSLFFALYLGIIVAYMILASQYNSFINPLAVLLALPFSISGALLALRISGDSVNIFSMIGLILLMGIVKKNSILLVDFTNQRRREGMPLKEALLTACPQRLRPILMTSFATIASAIPAALALGAGSETRTPMGVVVIGGVIMSTFLTLFVVPCAYSLMARLEKKPKGKKADEGLKGPTAATAEY
jgi:HAE1 family hydrophobic/amphiphilic exporter-1